MQLSHYLTADLIRLRVGVADWPAAIRVAGDLLVRAGTCTPAYVDAIIDAVHDIGPYIVLAPGLALAHAHPTSGVVQPGLSLVTLDPPVAFGSQDNDPVTVVIAFGAVDANGHIDLLSELARFLGNEHYYERVRVARSIAEVLTAVRDYDLSEQGD